MAGFKAQDTLRKRIRNFPNSNDARKLWKTVVELPDIITKPVGLGARDTLRLEKDISSQVKILFGQALKEKSLTNYPLTSP